MCSLKFSIQNESEPLLQKVQTREIVDESGGQLLANFQQFEDVISAEFSVQHKLIELQ